MVKVYQAQTNGDRDFRLNLDFKRGDDLVEFVKDNLDRYTLVAQPMRTETQLGAILEEAFRLTNSIDYSWYEDENTMPMFPEAWGGCRSTSVGDVIEFAGVKYVVDGYGFKCLED